MKTNSKTKLMSLLLATLMMLATMTPIMTVFAEDQTTYVLDIGSLADVAAGTKADGDTDTGGTDNFFTVHYKSTSRIESNAKTFSDGYSSTKRFNPQGALTVGNKPMAGISFTTEASAEVKIWWVCGDVGRQMTILDSTGAEVATTGDVLAKNELCVSTLTIDKAGKYYLGGSGGNNYIYKVTVTTKTLDKGPRADWSTVAAPTFATVEKNAAGQLSVTVNGFVDHNGADYLTLKLIQDGKVISSAKSTSVKSEHTFLFSPIVSGDYTLEAYLTREGEEDKKATPYDTHYVLPLDTPYITNCSNLGGGSVNVVWNPVKEAESYNVYVDGTLLKNITDRSVTVDGLSIGSEVTVSVEAVRGEEISPKGSVSFKVEADKNIGWNYVIYGPSAKEDNNSFIDNGDGTVTISSRNNGGKLQPTGADGLGFYYTAVPADKNFTFRATMVVNRWSFTNGQEGFGLMVTDHVPSMNYHATDFWTNQYMAVSTKIEYRYEDNDDGSYNLNTNESGVGYKYSMKLGIGSISKTGINQTIIDRTTLGETGLIVGQNGYLKTVMQSLEGRAGLLGKPEGTYNIIGNCANAAEGTLPDEYLFTEITLEIQKNNTGYFINYYDKDGNLLRTIKDYDPSALEQFDEDFVYVGMFTARNANITFKDISLTTIDPADDLPAEERPIEYITPTVTVTSSTTTSSTDYELVADTNLDGTLEVLLNNVTLLKDIPVKKYERFTSIIDISKVAKYGENYLVVRFTPDPDQELPPYTELINTNSVIFSTDLTLFKGNYHRKTIYVSPTGDYTGTGSKEYPYDIYTAVNSVIPGQTIVLMEGTYDMEYTLKIQRGMNGTEENPIRMIADPEATTRPVLDFGGRCAGILHGGNYWYFYGFDVTNSQDGQKGFQVSGNNNTLDRINTYHNGNTGIQISRYSGVDLYIDQWPANNLILNCTSYGNADSGYEDADGFAAKLTIGEGNVFDGCVAYNNADDGWDLFAKVATGSIGAVVIRNCVAYGNGYLEDGTNAGNGNGFKMGGDSLSGKHQLINSIAFNNKAKGIDSNSCPDIIVKNCISYNNESYNVAFYTNSATNTDFSATGIISFKDNKLSGDKLVKDNLKPKGNQDVNKYQGSTNFYWTGETSVNDAGKKIQSYMFVSLDFKGITRNADGSINMNGFLELKASAPAGSGTTGDFTASSEITLAPDLEHNYSEEWVNTDPLVHWNECECGDRANIGSHTFEYVIDKEPTMTEPGFKHNECTVCGHKRPQIEIPPLQDNAGDEPNEPIASNIFEIIANFFRSIFEAISKFFANLF